MRISAALHPIPAPQCPAPAAAKALARAHCAGDDARRSFGQLHTKVFNRKTNAGDEGIKVVSTISAGRINLSIAAALRPRQPDDKEYVLESVPGHRRTTCLVPYATAAPEMVNASIEQDDHMKNLLSKIAPVGICILALASTAATMVTPASAAAANSRDCKIAGICSSSDPNFHGNVRSRPVLQEFSDLF